MRATLFSLVLLTTPFFTSALGPRPGQIKNVVTFGDSYTDIVSISDGGTPWPVYLAGYANLNLFSFARSGGTCSNASTPRVFPGVTENEIPDYLAERANGTLKKVNDDLAGTVHTLWIGTNDLGVGELLTGQQTPGVTVVDVVNCVANWVTTLYEHGARNFIVQNALPLEHTILYSADSYPNRYWVLERNTTEWSIFMTELSRSYNQLTNITLKALAPELPGAHVGLFDSHGLFSDMIAHPQNYLNGTAPLNVTGAVDACVYPLNAGPDAVPECTVATSTDKDSFLWFDELHPSEQADRVVARNMANAISRKSEKWITWFS